MWDIVMFEEPGKDAARAESIRFERDENEDGRREWMAGALEVDVEFRYQRSREIHD